MRQEVGRSDVGLDAGEELAGDHDPLDLVGALVDLGDLGVAHHPLDGVLAGVAVAPEDLHGVGGDLHCHVGGEALGGGAEAVRSLSPRSERPAAA